MPTFMFNLLGTVCTIVGAVWLEERFRHADLHHAGGFYAAANLAMPAFAVLTIGLFLMLGAAILHHLVGIEHNTEFSGRALAEISEAEAIKSSLTVVEVATDRPSAKPSPTRTRLRRTAI